jgi:hypothetical protein
MDTRFSLDSSVQRGAFARLKETAANATAQIKQDVKDDWSSASTWAHAHFSAGNIGSHVAFDDGPSRCYFGGLVPLGTMNLSPEAQVRVMLLQDRFTLTRALGNGDCGYNAFLGCLLWSIASKSDATLDRVYGLFASLVPQSHIVGHRYGDLFRARRGHATLLQFIAAMSGATPQERAQRLHTFCSSAHFEEVVGFLRFCTARQQLAEATPGDGDAVWEHVDRSTTVAGSHASWFELRALAQVLSVDLTVANPIESDDPCVYTYDDAWGRVALLCWAEQSFGAGHFDGLLPRYQ